MDNSIVLEIKKWMETFVETPHPSLGNWPPCPYARQSRINNTIEFVLSTANNLIRDIDANLHLLHSGKDVIVILFDHTEIEPENLINLVQQHNKTLMPNNYVILEDHPGSAEFVNGVKMNFEKCGLLIIQCLDKLNNASTQLQLRGYYNYWDEQAKDDVVTWRFQ